MLSLILIGVVVIIGVVSSFIAFYLTDFVKKRYEVYKARKNLLHNIISVRDNYYNFEDKMFDHIKEDGPVKSICCDMNINKNCIVTYELPIKDDYKNNFYYPCIVRTRYINGVDVISEGWMKIDKKLADSAGLKIKEG